MTPVLLLATACGSGGSSGESTDRSSGSAADGSSDGAAGDTDTDADAGEGAAADTTVCRASATALPTPYADDFPTAWAFPPSTTAYAVEDRGEAGVIVTAVSSLPFDSVLDFLNHDEVDRGFKILDGETEDRDAEATWDAGHYRGRWAIRASATCPGETVVQVVAVPAS